ncbi:hypothetical protein JRQ81_009214 [Phrynocephalus forsythii]|uniref:Protein MENT n=1 Tax=Phrynocephalus forsythii TaxID=171643 RepID=A0A9Q1ARY6_9SAUR|nr:hypothetical protein JRQ81_009214 [Phrynocephalus forsythii]
MALGGASLVVLLMVWLWNPRPLAGNQTEEDMVSSQASVPPELLAKAHLAAKATLEAGYTSTGELESAEVEGTAAKGISSEATPEVTPEPETSSGKESVIIVGDTRYAWQEWSPWHCNCLAGSMSRVRDITYSAPGVRLDPVQYDVLRFERQVCSYEDCQCNRTAHQCDQAVVSCAKGPMHLCALEDIHEEQDHQRRKFWARVLGGLKRLLQTLRDLFPSQGKASNDINSMEHENKSWQISLNVSKGG